LEWFAANGDVVADESVDALHFRAEVEARQPLGRLVRPGEIAEVVHHLAELESVVSGFDYRLDASMTSLHMAGS
jgi:hypothetical protein